MRLPKNITDEIARIVHSVCFSNSQGGSCVLTARFGQIVLKQLGIDATLVYGGMMYRASHRSTGTLAMCHPQLRVGMVAPDGYMAGHVWLEALGCIIDFSSANWHFEDDVMVEQFGGGWGLFEIDWDFEPPDYIWKPKAIVPRMRKAGVPKKGEYWYGSWAGPAPNLGNYDLEADYRDYVAAQIEAFGLRQAVAECLQDRVKEAA